MTIKNTPRLLENEKESAKEIHKGKFDYSLVVLLPQKRDKVKIVCPNHGVFEQSWKTHLKGSGCRLCDFENRNGKTRIPYAEVIYKIKEVHGDKYKIEESDYKGIKAPCKTTCSVHNLVFFPTPTNLIKGTQCSECVRDSIFKKSDYLSKLKIVYGEAYTFNLLPKRFKQEDKVSVVCKQHGKFKNTVQLLLAGIGCPSCAREETYKNKESEFIKKAQELNSNLDYSKVSYTGSFNKCVFVCPTHGSFKRTPGNFLSNPTCPHCNGSRLNKDIVASKAAAIHGTSRYDYALLPNAVKRNDSVDIICPTHGIFNQRIHNHLQGCGCPECRILSKDVFISRSKEAHGDFYDYSNVVLGRGASDKIEIICPDHGKFTQSKNHHMNGSACPQCARANNKLEAFVKDILLDCGVDFMERDRTLLKSSNLEVDFLIPSNKLAIEVNGLFWHSESMGKDKNYHLNKTEKCNAAGYRLIHIFEDEIINKPDIVRSRLRYILGKVETKIFARKCEIRVITPRIKNDFLEKNHIQGSDKSSVNLGLYHANELVSVMTFCKPRLALGRKKSKEGEWELSRFASLINYSVIGGASRLLKHFENTKNPTSVFSFADRRWSYNSLYTGLGLEFVKTTKPNYWYYKSASKLKRLHRFNFRKQILADKLKSFAPELTEKENMKNNGFHTLWDCGSYLFRKIF